MRKPSQREVKKEKKCPRSHIYCVARSEFKEYSNKLNGQLGAFRLKEMERWLSWLWSHVWPYFYRVSSDPLSCSSVSLFPRSCKWQHQQWSQVFFRDFVSCAKPASRAAPASALLGLSPAWSRIGCCVSFSFLLRFRLVLTSPGFPPCPYR